MSAVRPSFLALCLFVAVLAHVIPAVLGQVTCMQQLNQLGGYYSPLDGKCDPYIPGVNAASTAAADHTTGATFTSTAVNSLNSITNFVIVLLANDGFDNLLGTFAGANNLAKSTIGPQVQRNGTSYGATLAGLGVDPYNYNFDSNVPNAPFNVLTATAGHTTTPITISSQMSNPSHNTFQTPLKINGGLMNQFCAWSINKSAAMSMSYYDLSAYPNTGLWKLASQYTLLDGFLAGSFGDLLCAEMYTIGAGLANLNSTNPGCPINGVGMNPANDFASTEYNPTTQRWEMTDDTQQPTLDRSCYLIGDLNAANLCPLGDGATATLLPTIPNGPGNPKHIGDLLDQQGVSWSYYSENLVAAEALCDAGQNYRPTGWNPHMQPFNHFSTFASQTSSYWTTHQKDGLTQFFPALNASTLEAVTWYRPESTYCYGFGNASPAVAAQWMDAFVANITATQLWQQNKLMVIFTFANANGLFDHVPPYVGDAYGPGLRVPTIIMSPFHKVGSTAGVPVDSTPYEHYSIFKMLARRFGVSQSALQSIWGTTRFMAAGDLTSVFKNAAGPTPSNSAVSTVARGLQIRTAGGAMLLALLMTLMW